MRAQPKNLGAIYFTPEARERLRETMATLDEANLRHLSPGALLNLQALTKQLGVAWPDPALRELATRLTPPDGRP